MMSRGTHGKAVSINKLKAILWIAGIALLGVVIVFGFAGCPSNGGGGDDNNGGNNNDGNNNNGGDNTTPVAPTITTTTLPDGTTGMEYSQTLTATGDTPITWSIDSGTLPEGLSLAATGAITGAPTAAETYSFTVKATNAAGNDTQELSITVALAYVVTPSGSNFTASGGALTSFTPGTIQTVIDAIRTDANGKACTITFGDGTPLNISTASIGFTGAWGAITLLGSVTSANTTATQGTIYTGDSVSIESRGVIANTGNSPTNSRAIYNGGTGRITVSDGTVSATTGCVIYNNSTGTITVSGGTVSAITGIAIYNFSTGTVTVSGGTVSAGTVFDDTNGSTIVNESTGTITVSGGIVSATRAFALYNDSTGTIIINNKGTVFAYGIGQNNVVTGSVTLQGNGLIVWWTPGSLYYFTSGETTSLGSSPATATKTWGKSGADSGINYANGDNTGFIKVDGVTVN